MADIIRTAPQTHELKMKDRKELALTGVCEVLSFDDSSVTLKTVCGELEIDGSGLKISSLDTANGTIFVSGNVQAFSYSDKGKDSQKGIIGRIFG